MSQGTQKQNLLRLAPWAVLLISMSFSILAFLFDRDFQDKSQNFRIDREIEIRQSRIVEHLKEYEDALHGTRGLFYASELVSRKEFKDFVNSLNIDQRFPGIRGLGFAQYFGPASTTANIAKVWPATDSVEKHIVAYVEPESNRTTQALGFDLGSEASRREAIERARDTGTTQITAPIHLIQDSRSGLIIFVPVYRESQGIDSVEARRREYLGSVFAVLNTTAFVEGALGGQENPFLLRIIDGPPAQGSVPFYMGPETRPTELQPFHRQSALSFFGRTWTINWQVSRAEFRGSYEDELILVFGIAFAFLFFWLMHSMLNTRNSAVRIAEDMTREIRATSSFKSAILNSTRYMIITSDRDNVIQHMNQAAEIGLGYTLSEAIGKLSAISLIAPEEFASRRDEMQGVLDMLDRAHLPGFQEAAKAFESEWTYVRKDGSRFPARLSLSAIRDENGQVSGYVIICRDISVEKEIERVKSQAEAALKESEDRFKAFMDNSPTLVAIKDDQGRVLYMNDKIGRRFGVKANSWLGKTVLDYLPEEAAQLVWTQERKILETGHPDQETTVLKDRNGEDCYLLSMRFPLNAANGRKFIGIISIDITEQKRNEFLLQETLRAAEAANVAKSEFLANMSHEIRTPMNGIMGVGELLLQTPLSADQRELLTIIRGSADSLLAIINDILDFSKIDAGKMHLDPVEFDLADTVNTAVKTLALAAEKKDLRFTCEIDPAARLLVFGDPLRLTQILINLVGNAIKFTQAGEIKVQVERVETEANACQLRFKVRDSGIGIAPDQMGRIFKAFMQADGSMTRTFGGSGLGLTISSRLVELMGGRIEVDSKVGEGSCFQFSIELPERNRNVKELLLNRPKDERNFEGLRILLTEDNVVNQTLASRVLEKRNCKPLIANNGEEAVEIFVQKKVDLILMDIQMPVMTGLEATRKIRAIEKEKGLRPIPIVAVTAHAMQGDREKYLEAGMDAYISKPIRIDELTTAIERLIPEVKMSQSEGRKFTLVSERKILDDLDSDWDLIKEVGSLFLETANGTVNDLRKAVENRDARSVEHFAHKFKGAAAIFGAEEIVSLAQTIEDLGENGDLATVPQLFERLIVRSQDLRKELQHFLTHKSAA